MSDGFVLHARLLADTHFVADWPLSRILLMNDARYSWLVLVPRRVGMSELHDLREPDRILFVGEVARASASLKTLSGADKINVAALGNIVPQLHVHVVTRFVGDPAWPRPVWGFGEPVPYDAPLAKARIAEFRLRL